MRAVISTFLTVTKMENIKGVVTERKNFEKIQESKRTVRLQLMDSRVSLEFQPSGSPQAENVRLKLYWRRTSL